MVLKFIRPTGAIYIGVSKMNRSYLRTVKTCPELQFPAIIPFFVYYEANWPSFNCRINDLNVYQSDSTISSTPLPVRDYDMLEQHIFQNVISIFNVSFNNFV